MLSQLLQRVHLIVHAIQLVQLLLEFARSFQVACRLTPFDFLLQIAFRLLVALLQLLQPVLHLLQLLDQLLLLFLRQLAVLQLFLQVLEFVDRLLEVALLHRLSDLVRRPACDILEPVQLLAHLVHAAQLFPAILQRLGQIVHLDQGFLAIDVGSCSPVRPRPSAVV